MFSKSYDLKEKILKLPLRRKIFNVVKENAGCHFREVERRSGFSVGIVKYHLDYLAKHDIIRREKIGNNIRYFPIELSFEDKRLLGLLRSKSHRHIIIYLISKGAGSQKLIASFVGLSQSTVSWHLKLLVEKGVVNAKKKNGGLVYFLQVGKGKILKLLIAYKESFLDSLVDRTIKMWG